MNTNSQLKLTSKATQAAVQKISSFAATGIAPYQMREFSLKPHMKLLVKNTDLELSGAPQQEFVKKEQEINRYVILKTLQKQNEVLDVKQAQLNHFLGNWGKWGKWSRSQDQEEVELKQENGWSNEELDSEYSDSEWMANKRPGMYERGYSDEEADHDRWDDSDDDDQGGHMMPLPQ